MTDFRAHAAVVGSSPVRAFGPPRLRRFAVAGALVSSVFGACYENAGVQPPDDQLFFPAGMLTDPRPELFGSETGEGRRRWLFVSNSNSDRNFSGGTVTAVDLNKFWDAWFDEGTGAFLPYCESPDNVADCGFPDVVGGTGTLCRCIQPPGAEVDGKRPCRHAQQAPQVIECDESEFVVSSVRVGHFGTRIAASRQHDPDGKAVRLWVPVRSDPSLVYIDVTFKEGADPEDHTVEFECEQDNEGFCAGDHRMTHLFNDKDGTRLTREPFNIVVDEAPGYRYAYLAHAGGGALSRVYLGTSSLEKGAGVGLSGPQIIEQLGLFSSGNVIPGGFGLAVRPCSVVDDNVPNLTKECARPLVYGSFRFSRNLLSFTVTPVAEEDFDLATGLRSVDFMTVGGLDPGGQFGGPVLGDIAFADPRGEELYVVQTNPGALLQMDTSLAFDGEPENVPAAPPIELCQQPSTMVVHDDGVERLAFVACFRSAYIFVVDLSSFRIVASIVGGTGPDALEIDAERNALYAANTLEASLSVIDISRTRKTRFTEIARLGLSDPFGR